MVWLPALAAVVALATATVAALWDLATGRIPNALTYGALLLALVLALAAMNLDTLGDRGLGFVIGGLPGVVLFAIGSIGGGDVKLMAAIGALLGAAFIADIWLIAIVIGALIALSMVLTRGRGLEVLRALGWDLLSLAYPGLQRTVPAQDLKLPFAVPIALATPLVLFLPTLRPLQLAFPQLAAG